MFKAAFGISAVVSVIACVFIARTFNRNDPVSGHPRLNDEIHEAVADGGPWIARIPGKDGNTLVCLDGTRVSLKRATRFCTAHKFVPSEVPPVAQSDFPVMLSWWDTEVTEVIRCSDGKILWSGPRIED